MAGPYEDSWNEFRRRTFPRYEIFGKFLQKNFPECLDKTTSMLDIGAGDGDFDLILIEKFLPRLAHYNGVEADEDLCRTLKQKIQDIKNRDVQVNTFHGFMELYEGPPQPVDLVVMCAVAYYIPDKKRMVEDALGWLKPGGNFIMIHWPQDTPMVKGQVVIRENKSAVIDSSFDGAPLLKDMGLKFTEHRLDVPFDVTKDGLERVLRIVLHRIPTEEEVDKFSATLEPYSETKEGRIRRYALLNIGGSKRSTLALGLDLHSAESFEQCVGHLVKSIISVPFHSEF